MSPTLISLYVSLSAVSPVLYGVRQGRAQTLVALQTSSESPELSKGQTFGPFTPTELEGQYIDLAMPKVIAKVDPMADRCTKSSVERPVAFVLRAVRENPELDRKALIALCVSQGVADYTARTQVQVGLKRRKAVLALQEQARQEQADMQADEEQAEEQADEVNE
jgi:hypothetical protein